MTVDELVETLEEIRDREPAYEVPHADAENALVEWFVANGHEEVKEVWDEITNKHPWYYA